MRDTKWLDTEPVWYGWKKKHVNNIPLGYCHLGVGVEEKGGNEVKLLDNLR